MLATVYAVLAAAGHALHQHEPTSPPSGGASHTCEFCCCSHKPAAPHVDKSPTEEGWSAEGRLGGHDCDACAACRGMAQMKLGQAFPPTLSDEGVQVCRSHAAVEPQFDRSVTWRIAARGPPVGKLASW